MFWEMIHFNALYTYNLATQDLVGLFVFTDSSKHPLVAYVTSANYIMYGLMVKFASKMLERATQLHHQCSGLFLSVSQQHVSI